MRVESSANTLYATGGSTINATDATFASTRTWDTSDVVLLRYDPGSTGQLTDCQFEKSGSGSIPRLDLASDQVTVSGGSVEQIVLDSAFPAVTGVNFPSG
ncbi:MAG: hypothetical protein D6738_15275, partial [Acidobacteria bacterium]